MNIIKNILKYNYYLNGTFNLNNVSHHSNLHNLNFYIDFYEEYHAPDNTYYDDEESDDEGSDDGGTEIVLYEYENVSIFDIPALNNNNRTKIWTYLNNNGKILVHRKNDLPAIIIYYKDNEDDISNMEWSKKWYQYGVLHRNNGPAVIYSDGTQIWYKNGLICEDNNLIKH